MANVEELMRKTEEVLGYPYPNYFANSYCMTLSDWYLHVGVRILNQKRVGITRSEDAQETLSLLSPKLGHRIRKTALATLIKLTLV